MLYLISYDVSTQSKKGAARLRRIAKLCEDYGVRVQNSVFECEMSYDIYLVMRDKLCELMEPKEDSLRIYPLGKGGRKRVIHLGLDRSIDMDAPLLF